MVELKKLDWFPFKIHRAKASRSWKLPDYQWCWYFKLIVESMDSERPGYLPEDPDKLWKLAGAKSAAYFRSFGGPELVSQYFLRTEFDGQVWIYNKVALETLKEQNQKLKKSSSSLSLKGFCSLEELEEQTQKLFAFYVQLFERNKGYRLTAERKKRAQMRLLEFMEDHAASLPAAVEAAKDAMKRVRGSPFHWDGGYFDWIDQFFKSREEFQKRLDFKVNGNHGKASKVESINSRNDKAFGNVFGCGLYPEGDGDEIPPGA